MRFGSDLSTGALMRLVVLIALELVLFRGVWSVVLVPRVTMMIVALNLGLYLVLIRPRHLDTPAVGMMIAALMAVLAATAYSAVRYRVLWPAVSPRRRLWPFDMVWVGALGHLAFDALSRLLSVPPNPASPVESLVLKLGRWVPLIESVLLDLIGLGMMLAGGRYGRRWRRGKRRGDVNEPARELSPR
jgi:hypothetical protein